MWSSTLIERILWYFLAVCLSCLTFLHSMIYNSSSIWIMIMTHVSVDCLISRFKRHGSVTAISHMENERLVRIHHLWTRQSILNVHKIISRTVTKTSLHCLITTLRWLLRIDAPHQDCLLSWWRHEMETFSALLAICVGNSQVLGEFPAQRPVTRRFYVFFDLRLNERLSKQSWGWGFETPTRPLWRHRNELNWEAVVNILGSMVSH